MGTLTANSTRLPEYCEHKLPTSCRLSSIPNCCACADERVYAAAYSTYIDGVGFVARGNRWQRYCWFCKEFWEQRVRVSGLRPPQTRIPEVPDQTDFIEKWYEFHRGYRIVRKEDGSEERVAVLGEDFKEVNPGCLPRTLEELRVGRRREEAIRQVRQEVGQEQQDSGPSLEDTLEQMFVAASSEGNAEQERPSVPAVASSRGARVGQQGMRQVEADAGIVHSQERTIPAGFTSAQRGQQMIDEAGENLIDDFEQPTNVHAQSMNPPRSRNREYQVRRVTALRRELNRMRNGIERVISGLRDLGEEVANHDETTGRLVALGQTLESISDTPSRAEVEQVEQVLTIDPVTNSAAPSTVSQTDRTLFHIQVRVDEARAQMEEARRARDQAASELDLAEQEFRSSQQRFQQLQREQRSTENYIRIFGTREEMLAQGENYESPIGGMFRRANERFREAEEARREERTLRQVLEDEARTGGEEEARRLAELESRERDVWSVPQLRAASRRSVGPVHNEAHPTPRYAGLVTVEGPDLQRTAEHQSTNATPEGQTPPLFTPTGQETMLQDYYAMLRQQDRNQQAPPAALRVEESPRGVATDNIGATQSMIDAIVAAREREVAERNNPLVEEPAPTEPPAEQLLVLDGSDNSMGLYERVSTPRFSQDEWWNHDADHIVRALTTNDELRVELGMTQQEASALLTYFIEDMVSESDRTTIDGLLRDPRAIWGTRLPAEWLQRWKEQNPESTTPRLGWFFVPDEDVPGSFDWADHHNPFMRTELVAQAFQMSSDIRRLASSLSPPDRLQMLYRLQAGQRIEGDVAVLESIRDSDLAVMESVVHRYRRNVYPQREDAQEENQRWLADRTRRDLAQDGDHSRQELDARRRETGRAFALAAGRQAMQTGSQALMERMADRDEGTRAAYHRLQANNYVGRPTRTRPTLYRQLTLSDYLNHDSESENTDDSEGSDKEEGEEAPARGLDARESGRPEPKDEGELQVQMDCKICYTQLSEVACLPCGHLVMCRWCSEQHSPCLQHDLSRPRRAASCPVCRKGIRQKVRVFRA